MPPASASFSSRAATFATSASASAISPSSPWQPPDTANVYPSVGDIIPDILLPVEGQRRRN